jgi:alkylation response protein AidB-like acyl-CoA dehydrogenase
MNQAALTANQLRLHPAFHSSALLGHDAAGCINTAAEAELDRRGIGALLVPPEHGGSRPAMPDLMLTLRDIGRFDLALGLGSCITALMAATNVWLAGNDAQNRRFGEILRRGGRVAIAFHELAHGNDLPSTQVAAEPGRDSYRLSGAKEVINNIDRADAAVLFASTGGTNPRRAHSLFLLEREHLAGPGVALQPRHDPVGVRACRISGIRFDQHEIPASCLLGTQGAALEYTLRAFQTTRTLLPGVSLGAVATAHGLVTQFALTRRLYGANLLALPLVRATLAQTAAEIWAADCLTRLLAACLHLAPGAMQAYGSLGKYLVPKAMQSVLRRLAETLGARFYLRGGEYGLFEKIVRDYPVLSFGHAGALVCQASVVPFLPRMLGQRGQALPLAGLLDTSGMPPFNPQALTLRMPTGDPLLDSLPDLIAVIDRGQAPFAPHVATAYRAAAVALMAERERMAGALSPATSVSAGEDVRRYGLMLTAAAVLLRRVASPSDEDVADDLSLLALDELLRKLGLCPAAQNCVQDCMRPEVLRRRASDAVVDHLTVLSNENRSLV